MVVFSIGELLIRNDDDDVFSSDELLVRNAGEEIFSIGERNGEARGLEPRNPKGLGLCEFTGEFT